MLEKLKVQTNTNAEMKDITQQVKKVVEASGIQEGIAVIYSPHTTAGITINEGADPDVVHDLLYRLDKDVPWKDQGYRHGEGNTAAHMKTVLTGSSQTVPISSGRLALGTWQSIYFCEYDGPRRRTVLVKVLEG